MRPVLIDDLLALAGFLETIAPGARRRAVLWLCDRAHLADRQRKRLGRIAPRSGNGSLNAAVHAVTRAGRTKGTSATRAGVGSAAHLSALLAAVEGVVAWKAMQACRGGRARSCPAAGWIAETGPSPYSSVRDEHEARHG